MTQLILVRHGQASFGQANYDKLSELGAEQARIAGRALRAQRLDCDALIAGDMSRQQVTAEQASAAFDSPPAIQTRTAFNEYDAGSIFSAYMPRVLVENPGLAARQKAILKDSRLFQSTFTQMFALWQADASHPLKQFETWPAFRDRVREGLAAIHRDFDREARIAVFTSGGPIAVAVGAALGLGDDMIMQINEVIYNASFTEFRSTKTGWRLIGLNNISHLRQENDPTLVTHR